MSVMPGRLRNWLDERRMTAVDLPIWLLGMIVALAWFALHLDGLDLSEIPL